MPGPIEQLRAALDALALEPPADGESVVELHRQQTRLEAIATSASASFDASAEWSADGAKTAAAWIAGRCHVPKEVAQRRVHLGRCLRSMPVTERAWLAGDVT